MARERRQVASVTSQVRASPRVPDRVKATGDRGAALAGVMAVVPILGGPQMSVLPMP
ncbi:MAG: hypothetical protein M1399_05380 [Actinobacteria bacterium]|nr:hypothetical protein [Actinomycetota bacterium]MCL5446061.1 hypothetical protein [Actinomycetota bacterium]